MGNFGVRPYAKRTRQNRYLFNKYSMKTEKIILTGINNLKAQLKKVMTEASTLEVMIREMESSLCGVDNLSLIHI